MPISRRSFALSLVAVPVALRAGAPQVRISYFDRTGKATGILAVDKIVKTDAQWRAQLNDQQFDVARRKGTEPAFTGRYASTKDHGIYTCVCCGTPLFSSAAKFESGTGWPSFYAPIAKENVATTEDREYGMLRVEVHCARCDGHLGHVFEDGPRPTGLRYCMNSASMNFVPIPGH
jgi:methionine-R-sulfoxide reductase